MEWGKGHEGVEKNEQVKKFFWTVFIAIVGWVMAQVVDPVTAQQEAGAIMGLGR